MPSGLSLGRLHIRFRVWVLPSVPVGGQGCPEGLEHVPWGRALPLPTQRFGWLCKSLEVFRTFVLNFYDSSAVEVPLVDREGFSFPRGPSKGVSRVSVCFWAQTVLTAVVARRRLPRATVHLLRSTVVTWLILPVVICLSQRLSHACPSINAVILWNCEWLIKSVIVYLMVPYYLDNRSNSRANTCRKSRLLEGMYLLDPKPARVSSWGSVARWFMITARIAGPRAGDDPFKFLPYQLSMVR